MEKLILKFNDLEEPLSIRTIYRDYETNEIVGFLPGWRIIFKKDESGNVYGEDKTLKHIKTNLLNDEEYNTLQNLLKDYDISLKTTEEKLLKGEEGVYLIRLGLDEYPYMILTEFEKNKNITDLRFRQALLNAYNKMFKTNIGLSNFNEFVSQVGNKLEPNLPKDRDILRGRLSSLPKVLI